MELTVLCVILGGLAALPRAPAASLTLRPDKSQFFVHESLVLGCDLEGNSSWWRVRHRGGGRVTDVCTSSDPDCSMELLYPMDTGHYWCESDAGERSEAAVIVVTGGAVILESPALPVAVGGVVTLLCTSRRSSSSSSSSHFYKNGVLIGSSPTGNLSVAAVSPSDEGIYKCNVSGVGESAPSRLTVRARRPESPTPPCLAYILLPVVGACLMVAVATLLVVDRRRRGKVEQTVDYTNVTFAREAQPQSRTSCHHDYDLDSGPTFYSTLNLASL